MSIILKNIILYDSLQRVQGFVELRSTEQITVKLRHNFTEPELLLAITGCGKTHIAKLVGEENHFTLPLPVDIASDEILASLIMRDGGKLETLASGIVNIRSNVRSTPVITTEMLPTEQTSSTVAHLDAPPPSRFNQNGKDTRAAREVDDLIKKLCTYEDDGIDACVGCEYRKHFYFDVSTGTK